MAGARDSWIEEAETEKVKEDRQRSDFLAYRDHSNRVVDFHALRHTFISNLANGGVHPKDAQALARHSTITLTMDCYTHTSRGKLATALEALPDLRHDPAVETLKATGTCDGAETHMSSCMSSDMSEQGTSEGLRLTPDGTQERDSNTGRNERKPLVVASDRSRLSSVDSGSDAMHRAGFEPATFGSVDRCSIQLSQRCVESTKLEVRKRQLRDVAYCLTRRPSRQRANFLEEQDSYTKMRLL